MPQREPPCDFYGDLNDDGYVTEIDDLLLYKYLREGWERVVGYTPLTESEFKRRADVNGDGVVDRDDEKLIQMYIDGVIDTFPICPPPTPSMRKTVSFSSVPSDASIYIDETPIEQLLVAQFREECLSDTGEVICTKPTLHDDWLITKKLSRIWWLLTDNERDNVAGFVITNWSSSILLTYTRKGLPDCKGGTEDWQDACCIEHSIIRFLRFANGEDYYDDISHCYWSPDKKTEYCYYWGESFGLPVVIFCAYTTSALYGHGGCALQIRKDQKDFNSWRFFQYTNDNIKPGDWQMPCYSGGEMYVRVERPTLLDCFRIEYALIAKWKIDKDTCEPVLVE